MRLISRNGIMIKYKKVINNYNNFIQLEYRINFHHNTYNILNKIFNSYHNKFYLYLQFLRLKTLLNKYLKIFKLMSLCKMLCNQEAHQ